MGAPRRKISCNNKRIVQSSPIYYVCFFNARHIKETNAKPAPEFQYHSFGQLVTEQKRKTKPRPILNIPKNKKIVSNKYPDFFQ